MTERIDYRLIQQNKKRARKGIGRHNGSHNPEEEDEEYQKFLEKYRKLTK